MNLYKGSCHCGKIQFETKMDLQKGVACNCSMCGRKGSLLAFTSTENFQLISGKEFLKDYQFGKKTIHHPFCTECGVSSFSHGITPQGAPMYAINIRCLEGVDPQVIEVQHFDGKNL